jgi:hypothetical protein|tara:strand:+ start:53 stop:652 length:600 start_codon:yes stop_codon:yes gene_type:complete
MKYTFKKHGFEIIKKAVDPKIANFIYNYFLMKKQVAQTLFEHRYISPFTKDYGSWEDSQVPGTYSHYADIAMETLLLLCQPIMEKHTKLKLSPTYSYARIYKQGDELKRHKDRFSCEISTTMNLGGDPWSIFIESVEVKLKPGDMLIYKGQNLEHWREPFKGIECAQVFLHYNNIKKQKAKDNLFDGRMHLGLPAWFKK